MDSVRTSQQMGDYRQCQVSVPSDGTVQRIISRMLGTRPRLVGGNGEQGGGEREWREDSDDGSVFHLWFTKLLVRQKSGGREPQQV